MGWMEKLKQGLQKTKQLLNTDVRDLFKSGELLDESHLEDFEARLIRTDMGVAAASETVARVRKEHLGRTVDVDAVWSTVQQSLQEIFAEGNDVAASDDPLAPLNQAESGPTVILVAGVNGVGKTTSIAKLAKFISSQGKSVMLAAADTFRAAAVEQLTMWSERIGCPIVTRPSGTDPASVAYAGCEQALEQNVDYLIVDTAGRLQTQSNLMSELEKIHRVVGKKIPGGPHETLLVLDATTGQNGISQAEHFSQAIQCTGIILTKLDGTAKGGIVVAIRQRMGIPVKYIGVGEQIDDLQPFNAGQFVEALFAR